MRALGLVLSLVLLAGCAATRDPALARAEERIASLEERIAKLEAAPQPPLVPTIWYPSPFSTPNVPALPPDLTIWNR